MKYLILILALLSGCGGSAPRATPIPEKADPVVVSSTSATGSAPTVVPHYESMPAKAGERYSMKPGAGDPAEKMVIVRPPESKTKTAIIKKAEAVKKPDASLITDSIISQLSVASMAFTVPSRSNIHDPVNIQLIIDKSVEPREAERELTKSGSKVSTKIMISKIMEAKVIAPDFTISELGPSQQAMANSIPTEWNWTLIPKSPGVHDVHLIVTAIVNVDGVSTNKQIKTFDKVVTIDITVRQRFFEWFHENWKWVFSVVIGPALMVAWRQYKLLTQLDDKDE